MLKLLLYYHPLPRWRYGVQILLFVKLFLGRFAVISRGKIDFLGRRELGGTAMNKPCISHEEATIESFKKDPDMPLKALRLCLKTATRKSLWLPCAVSPLLAKLNSKSLYSALFSAGNPELRSFQSIFGAMGIRLTVTPLAHEVRQWLGFKHIIWWKYTPVRILKWD